MSEILNNLLYMLLGVVIGLYLDYTYLHVKYMREVKELLARRKKNERGWYTHRLSLFLVLAICIYAAIWTGIVNTHVTKSQHCTETTFTKVITTLTERTSATTDVNIADTAQSLAFATLLTRLLDNSNPPTREESRQLTQDYLNKLQAYNEAKANRDKVDDFPSKEAYHDCLRK